MNDFRKAVELLHSAGRFCCRSLLPGLLLYTFPTAVLLLSMLSSFLLSIQHDNFRSGTSVGLIFFLLGIFISWIFYSRIRRPVLLGMLSIFVAAQAMLLPLPAWIYFVITGFALGGFFVGRSSEQRRYIVFGGGIAALSGYTFGAAWFYPQIWMSHLPLFALAAFSAVLVLSVRPGRRQMLWIGSGCLLCVGLTFCLSLYLKAPLEKIGAKWTFTPYGILYGIDGGHGYRIYAEDGSLLKDGDEAVLRKSVLPAVLQCRNDNSNVLYIGYTPSELPGLFRKFPNVRQVKVLSFSGDFKAETVTESPARVLQNFPGDYDLIFVAELPPSRDATKASFLNLLKQKLTEDGALVIPREIHPAGIGGEPLPGSRQYMTIYRRGTVIHDWGELEAKFKELYAMSKQGTLSPVLLDVLKNEPDVRTSAKSSVRPSVDFINSLRPLPRSSHFLLLFGLTYMMIRILVGRRKNLHFFFSAMENGFSSTVMLLGGVFIFSRYTLEYSIFPSALLLLGFFMVFDSRIDWVCKSLRGCYLLTLCYMAIPFLRINFDPMMILVPLMVFGAAGAGVVQKGISVRGKMVNRGDLIWFFFGAVSGAIVFSLGESESITLLALLALVFRILYIIRL